MMNVIILFLYYWVEFFPSQMLQKVSIVHIQTGKAQISLMMEGLCCRVFAAYRIIDSVEFLVGPGKTFL